MNLYDVKGGSNGCWEIRKIKAKTRQSAIIKFMELVDKTYHENLLATLFCGMTEIVEA